MSILESLDYIMKDKYCEYSLVNKNDNEREYHRKYFELERVHYNLKKNILYLSIPCGDVQYRTKFKVNDEEDILTFLDNRLN